MWRESSSDSMHCITARTARPGCARSSRTELHLRRGRRLAVATVLLLVASCGDNDGRPSDRAWQSTWESRRQLVPDAATFVDGGREVCDNLLGEFRVQMPELLPTPTEALDDAVHAWIDHAESLVFECPDDRMALNDRIDVLDVLAAEIDAGLQADPSD